MASYLPTSCLSIIDDNIIDKSLISLSILPQNYQLLLSVPQSCILSTPKDFSFFKERAQGQDTVRINKANVSYIYIYIYIVGVLLLAWELKRQHDTILATGVVAKSIVMQAQFSDDTHM